MRFQITPSDVQQMTYLQDRGEQADAVLLRKASERWANFVHSIAEPMVQEFSRVFPEVHRHPQTLPHEWAQPFDPANTPLAEHESSCSEARPMALVMDFERDGRRKLVIQ